MAYTFSIDRGGTFTDIFASVPDEARPTRVLKLLSVDPAYDDAPREGIRRIIEEVSGCPLPRGEPIDHTLIASIRMGTTVQGGSVKIIIRFFVDAFKPSVAAVATNALLERKGARMALLITRGFSDLLHIGTQNRPRIFDLQIAMPSNVYEHVIEVDERLVLVKPGEALPSPGGGTTVTGVSGELLYVDRSPDESLVRAQLQPLLEAGISSLAIVFMHSYLYPEHERRVAAIACAMGFTQVSQSSDVMPMVKIVPRGFTACADAYLTPHIVRYVQSFKRGFKNELADAPGAPCATRLSFMQSDGGLTPADQFKGNRSILSGPAGGAVGVARTAWDPATRQPVVAIDVGGTSSDVLRYNGDFEHIFETSIGGLSIQAPQLDINTVAAGGGSRLFFRDGLLVVGPESAGAHPGPVCYRKGGFLAVTDANLQLGRVQPELFPSIFGPTEDMPLDAVGTEKAFEAVLADVNAHHAAEGLPPMTVDELAYGFVQVANEAMCRPIRALTQMRGYDITTHVLACFGGAGPQHACALARSLGVKRIFISKYSSVLSAYGLSLADVISEAQAPVAAALVTPTPDDEATISDGLGFSEATANNSIPKAAVDVAFQKALASAAPARVDGAAASDLSHRLLRLAEEATSRLVGQGFLKSGIVLELFVNLRYQGTDTAIMISCLLDAESARTANAEEFFSFKRQLRADSLFPADLPEGHESRIAAVINAAVALAPTRFVEQYRREFGFVLLGRPILVEDVRVRGIAQGGSMVRNSSVVHLSSPPSPKSYASVFFLGGRVRTPVYQLSTIDSGHAINGPALLVDANTTIVLEPGFRARLTSNGDVEIVADDEAPSTVVFSLQDEVPHDAPAEGFPDIPPEPVQLSIFGHRFMGIAEQMGRVLQRTSVSVNIRERLDFSCALFGPTGGLVANAPHIPVHLGAMQDAVRYQLMHWTSAAGGLEEGDVLVSNHPQLAGGSHLPDITVMTPVFHAGRIVFFVASRGHHADVGGITPGSMPPNSKTLSEEGAAIIAFKLVRKGAFQEAGITELLKAPGTSGVPGCSGSRNLHDCLSDLRAQVAANQTGIQLVLELIAEFGLRKVQAYMHHIQVNAEVAVRDFLVRFSQQRGLPELGTIRAVDHMDDGTPIALSVTIDRRTGSAVFDFEGTGAEVFANTNAPRAVTFSAVIYCLRCFVGRDVPLNQGCLAPITICIPEGSLLHPSCGAAVVGGNVLTSQRVTDVILRAFGAAAASQGCMNNLTFGDATVGYYETICGGAGAGPSWHGRSGVHTVTDPEILERRYPVLLRRFTLRAGSGGAGAFRGGLGVVRELEFRRPLVVSILSERRAFRPYGMAGGQPGARGCNTLLRASSAAPISLGGKCSVSVVAGDRLRIDTPGGGGYGPPPGLSPEEASARVLAEAAAQEEEFRAAAARLPGSEGSHDCGEGGPGATGSGQATTDAHVRGGGSLKLFSEVQESA